MPRFPPKKILVPLDFSDSSVTAWKQAALLAERFGARVEGLYVQEWLHSVMGLGLGEPRATAQAGHRARENLLSLLGSGADVRSATGPVNETILSWGKNLGFDLIVMGTHGRTGLERAVKGSVAEVIIRNSSIPVLVVRKELTPRWRSVLAPINFERYSMDGLLFAAKAAEALGARLTLLHVLNAPLYADATAMEGPKQLLAKAVEKLPARLRHACRPKLSLAFGKPAEEISSAAQEADLVILAAHQKGALHDAILGTTAERVLRHCRKPVLAVPVRPSNRPKARPSAIQAAYLGGDSWVY